MKTTNKKNASTTRSRRRASAGALATNSAARRRIETARSGIGFVSDEILEPSTSSSCAVAARRHAARCRCRGLRLHRAHERAHELAFDLRRKGIDINAFAGEELARILDRVDPRRLDADRLEACLR